MHRLHPSQSARKQKVAAGDRGPTRGRDECQWQWQTDKQFVFKIPLLPSDPISDGRFAKNLGRSRN